MLSEIVCEMPFIVGLNNWYTLLAIPQTIKTSGTVETPVSRNPLYMLILASFIAMFNMIIIIISNYWIIVIIMSFPRVANDLSSYLILCLSSFSLSLSLSFLPLNQWILGLWCYQPPYWFAGTKFKWVQIGAFIVTSTSVSLVKGFVFILTGNLRVCVCRLEYKPVY